METDVTLHLNEEVINKAEQLAEQNNTSISKLVEFLLHKAVSFSQSLEDYPVADWVTELFEGEAVFLTDKRSSKAMKDEYYLSKK